MLGSAGQTNVGHAVPVAPPCINGAKLKYPHPQFAKLAVRMLACPDNWFLRYTVSNENTLLLIGRDESIFSSSPYLTEF